MIVKATILYPLNGGIMAVEFSFPRTAERYAREKGLAVYEIRVGSAVVARQGSLPR